MNVEGEQLEEEESNSECTAPSSFGSSDSVNNLSANFEVVKILTEKFHLPKDLCENPAIFKEFFSIDTWNHLPDDVQNSLASNLLPNFSENDDYEKQVTIQKLFSNDIVRFGQTPLQSFQVNLEDGNYRPDIAKLNNSLKKAQEREHKFQECERISRLAKNLMISREKLLRSAYSLPAGGITKVSRSVSTIPKLSSSAAASRAKKRYFQEINSISEELGLNPQLSEDENYPEGPPIPLTRKQKKLLSGLAVS